MPLGLRVRHVPPPRRTLLVYLSSHATIDTHRAAFSLLRGCSDRAPEGRIPSFPEVL
jgi:hypothetical protein